MGELILVKDNSSINELSNHPIVTKLVNKDLSILEKENFLIFPPQVTDSGDLEKRNFVFTKMNHETRTCNVVGVIGDGQDEIRISSRFSKENEEDYFLRYMMQKVLNYNIISTKVGSSNSLSYYDLLVFMFPYYLNKALSKGMYKEYVNKKYNDANVKGSIEIARHIRSNVPFLGKVAYRTREFSYNNKITQLIRHTIEKIQHKYEFIIHDEGIRESVRTIKEVTNDYNRFERQQVILENVINPVKHGYFSEYATLQQLCIQILNEDKTGFGNNENKVHGIIIDVAWLWEEYLDTLLKIHEFIHPQNRISKGGISIYKGDESNTRTKIYPDFYNKKMVIDAKYKRLDKSKKGIYRDDRYQIISYLHLLNLQKAAIVYPSMEFEDIVNIGELKGFGGTLFKLPFKIPQDAGSYDEFVVQILKSENQFLSNFSSVSSR